MPEQTKKAARPRRWRRWVMMSLDHDARAIVLVAKRVGMKIICAYRPGLCMWNSMGLYGTSAQMKKTERIWSAMGIKPDEIASREPGGAWPCNADIPERDWADPFILEGALPYLFHCTCGATWRGFVPETHPDLIKVLRTVWLRVHGGKGHKDQYWTLGHERAEWPAGGKPAKETKP